MYGADAKATGSSEGAGPLPTTRKGSSSLARNVGWSLPRRVLLGTGAQISRRVRRTLCGNIRSSVTWQRVLLSARVGGAFDSMVLGGEIGGVLGPTLSFGEVNGMIKFQVPSCKLTFAAHYLHPMSDPTFDLMPRPLPLRFSSHLPTERKEALSAWNFRPRDATEALHQPYTEQLVTASISKRESADLEAMPHP